MTDFKIGDRVHFDDGKGLDSGPEGFIEDFGVDESMVMIRDCRWNNYLLDGFDSYDTLVNNRQIINRDNIVLSFYIDKPMFHARPYPYDGSLPMNSDRCPNCGLIPERSRGCIPRLVRVGEVLVAENLLYREDQSAHIALLFGETQNQIDEG